MVELKSRTYQFRRLTCFSHFIRYFIFYYSRIYLPRRFLARILFIILCNISVYNAGSLFLFVIGSNYLQIAAVCFTLFFFYMSGRHPRPRGIKRPMEATWLSSRGTRNVARRRVRGSKCVQIKRTIACWFPRSLCRRSLRTVAWRSGSGGLSECPSKGVSCLTPISVLSKRVGSCS